MFDFVKRVLLQRPSTANVREVYNHINASLGSITTRVNLTTDRNAFRAAVSEVNNLNKGLKQSKNLADDFAGIVANATRRFAGISIATGTMLSLARGVKNAYKESLEFERQMKRVEIATGATQSEINKLSSSVLALGSAYGVSSTELASNARIFAQAGLSTRTTAKALEILAKTTVAGTFGDIGDTAEGVVASLQQFREEVIKTGGEVQFLERTFDSIQNVSKKYAIEAEDIVVGIRKAGAAFESAGGTIDELIGTMTTLRSTTRESASTLANSMKTIFTRIQRPETIDFLRNIGVELVDMEGKFVGPVEAINRLGAALAVLDKGDVRYAQIADKIGGIYQINRLLTLLKNTSMTSQAIDTSRDSSGVLSEDAQKGLETTISKIERLNQKFFDLIKTLGDTSTIRGVVDLLIRIADSAITVTKSLEPLMPMIAAMLGIAGGRFAFGVGRRLVGIASNPTSMAQTQVGGVATGGYIGGRGGRIRGGAQGIDTVPAMLDNGEFVINRKDAAKNIGLLTAINNGKNVQKFADGGPIMTGFYMNQYKTTKALSGSLNAQQYTKSEGEKFTRGKDGKLFNYEDEIKLKIEKISVGNEFAQKLNQYPATPDFVKNLKNYTQTSNDSLRGKAFEELYATVNGINLADNNTSRIDGIKGSSLYEFKSKTRNEPIENIIDKFFGAATEPRSNIDQAVFEALKSKKLTPYPETIDFGKNFKSLTLVEDSILGKGVLNRDATSSSLMSMKSTIPQLRKALADRGEIVPAGTSDSSMREMLKARGVEFKAKGGRIGGGKPGVDTVPAMLDNGEFVVNRKDSAKNIGLLTAINSGRDVPGFARGSMVSNDVGKPKKIMDAVEVEMQKSGKNFSDSFTRVMRSIQKQLENDLDISKNSKDVGEVFNATERSEKAITYAMTSKESVAKERVSRAVQESFLPKDQGLSKEYRSSVVNRARELKAAQEAGDMDKVAGLEAVGARYNLSGSHSTFSQSAMEKFNLNPTESATTSSSSTKNNQKHGHHAILKSSINAMSSGDGGPNIPGSPSNQNNPIQQLNKPTGDFTQKLLLAAGALSFLADSSGLTSDSFNKASVAAAATYTTIQVMGSAVSNLAETLSNFRIPKIGGGDVGDIDIDGGGGGAKSSRSGKSSGRFGKLRSLGGKIGGRLGGVGRLAAGAAGAAGGALTGIGIGVAGAQFISSYYGSEAEKKEQEKNEELKRIEEKGGGKAKLAELQAKSRAAALNKGKSENAMTAGVSGAISGAAIGAIVGGPLGAGIGGAVGGIGGAIAGSLSTTEKSLGALITTSERLALAQVTAAQGAYDFETSVSNIESSGLKGKDLMNAYAEVRKKAETDQKAIQSEREKATVDILTEKNWSNFFGSMGVGDYTLSDIGIGSEKGVASKAGKETIKKLNETDEEAQKTIAKAAQKEMSVKKDFIIESIGSAKSLQELEQISSGLGSELSAIGDLAYKATVGTEEEKRKAQKAAIDGAKVMEQKVKQAKEAEIVQTQAAIAARNLELESIRRSTASMLELSSMSDQMRDASDAFERFTTGFAKGVNPETFSDITKVSNQSVFAKKAMDVGSQFTGGRKIAQDVALGSQFISEFRSGISGQMADSFKSITGQKLGAAQTESAIFRELSQLSSFRNMDSGQKKNITSIVQGELSQGNFNADNLDKALSKVSDIFKRDSNLLAEFAEKLNQSIEKIRAYNETLIQSQAQITELRAGQVDIIAAGNSRMNEALARYSNIGTDFQALNQKDLLRTERSNTTLAGAGIGPISGDINALSNVLSSLQSRRNEIDKMQGSTSNAVDLAKLNTENQRLAVQIRAVTEELGKLANQSDKAADIMTKLEKVRQLKDYTGNRVKEFVSGGQQERSRMMREVYGLQQVMMSRNFNVLSDDIRGSVMKMMEERAKLDPTGRMQKIYDMSLNNAASQLGIPKELIQQAFGRPNNAENQLINTLHELNRKEYEAQQVLIDHQIRNTNATFQLINQLSLVTGQMINPALMQPRMFNNNPIQNFNMNQGMMNQNMNNNFNNMQMQHQMNVNGQLNVNGLNSDRIAQAIVQEVSGYVVRQVNVQMNRGRRGFRAGN